MNETEAVDDVTPLDSRTIDATVNADVPLTLVLAVDFSTALNFLSATENETGFAPPGQSFGYEYDPYRHADSAEAFFRAPDDFTPISDGQGALEVVPDDAEFSPPAGGSRPGPDGRIPSYGQPPLTVPDCSGPGYFELYPGYCIWDDGWLPSDPWCGKYPVCPDDPDANVDINYKYGNLKLAFTDLESAGFGATFGHTRTWTNLPVSARLAPGTATAMVR